MSELEQLAQRLQARYGDLDNEQGCYVDSGEWLSMQNVKEMIERSYSVEEFLEELEETYGDLSREIGCYIDGKWLSVERIACMARQVKSGA